MAAAWGIAALWFFCFGWWKDYLKSPTIAQRLGTRTHRSQTYFWFSHAHTRACTHASETNHATERCKKHTHMPFNQTARLTWLSDGRPQVSLQKVVTRQLVVTPRNTQRPFNQAGPWFTLPLWANCKENQQWAQHETSQKKKINWHS